MSFNNLPLQIRVTELTLHIMYEQGLTYPPAQWHYKNVMQDAHYMHRT